MEIDRTRIANNSVDKSNFGVTASGKETYF